MGENKLLIISSLFATSLIATQTGEAMESHMESHHKRRSECPKIMPQIREIDARKLKSVAEGVAPDVAALTAQQEIDQVFASYHHCLAQARARVNIMYFLG